MDAVKHIIYFGSDDEFYSKLSDCAGEQIRSKYKLIRMDYSEGAIISACCDYSANIVFIDFTSIKDRKGVLDEVIFLKRITKFKGTLFSALLGDNKCVRENYLLFCSGFLIGHIKGTEVKGHILDCFYIGLYENVSRPVFARAENIDCSLRVSLCSSLTSVSMKTFCLDTDLEVDDDEVSLKLHLFKDLEKESFRIARHEPYSLVYHMTDHYTLEYPYAGPWDEITPESLQEETVETWLDHNSEDLIKKKGYFSVISKNTKLYAPLFKEMAELPLFLEVLDSINMAHIEKSLRCRKPSLIFMDLEEESGIDIDSVADMINCLNEIECYSPILIILNNPSKAEALKKVYGYNSIVCAPTSLNVDVFKLFAKSFLDRNSSVESNAFFFDNSDPSRALEVYHDVQVKTLSEHALSFVSKCELPMFSVIQLNLPVACYVTLVPAFEKLEVPVKGTHYMGIIHVLSESDRQILRKFVNQIIYSPLPEFSIEAVETILDQKIFEKTDKQESRESKKETVLNYESFKRPEIRGKSKL